MKNPEFVLENTPDKSEKIKGAGFTAAEILKELRPKMGGRPIEYMGSATSHFQAEPLLYDAEGKPQIFSDWELEVVKHLEGKKSKILRKQESGAFPKFLSKKEQYIERAAELGENMFRFSLDFGRLCPRRGEFNSGLMAEYVKALALIRARGQEPMLTIHHWPMPKYLAEFDESGNMSAGAWENPEVNNHFRYYVQSVMEFLSNQDRVRAALQEEGFDKKSQDKFLAEGLIRYFISINEPLVIIAGSYVFGAMPPFKVGRFNLMKKTLEKLIEAHDITRDQIKSGKIKFAGEAPKVGAAYNWNYFDGALGDFFHSLMNKKILNKMEREGEHSDFLALQYYFRSTLPFYKRKGRAYSDQPFFTGDVYPPGLYEVLKKMNAEYPQKEIFVTEFGFSDKNDERRPYWILETMKYALEAVRHGIPLRGMLLWSLVNNFEWNLGMEQKLGLFDENELEGPLGELSAPNKIRGWEAWRAIVKAINNPSEENIQELESEYERSKSQFENYYKRSLKKEL